jgi:hypothetical protein
LNSGLFAVFVLLLAIWLEVGMSELKHTAPPWRFLKNLKPSFIGKDGYGMIAEIPHCFDADELVRETQKANANLIATAPELYTELEKCANLLRSYEAHHLQKGDRDKADKNRRRAENCERVLAKARGES